MEIENNAGKVNETSPLNKHKKKKNGNLYDRMLNKIKNNRVVAFLLIAGLVLTTAGTAIHLIGDTYNGIKKGVSMIKSYMHKSHTNYSAMMAEPKVKPLLKIIGNYYADVEYGRFKAQNYFAGHVDKYELVTNLTSAQVDSFYNKDSRDYVSPRIEIIDTALSFSEDSMGRKTIDFWTKFSCFRNLKGKYEFCISHVEFIFDKNNKIVVTDELEQKVVRFSDEREG